MDNHEQGKDQTTNGKIDELARMVGTGFNEVHNHMGQIRGDILEIKGDIVEIKNRLGGVEHIFQKEVERHDRNEIRLDNHEERIKALEVA